MRSFLLADAIISGEPKPKGRPRCVRRGNQTFAVTPDATAKAEYAFGIQFKSQNPGVEPTETHGLIVVLRFFCSTPSGSHYGGGRWTDIDNLQKLALDALNGVAWRDDCQIGDVHASLRRGDAEPRTEIEIWLP